MPASPCIRNTPSTTMSQDGSGDVGVDVELHDPDSGLAIATDGLYVNTHPVGGITRTVNGLFGRQTYSHVGWARGVNDTLSPGTAVGPGGYTGVNPVLGFNFVRQGPVSQYLHVSCGAEMGMGMSDFSENPFYGWQVALEVWYDFSPTWFEVAHETMGGYVNGFTHHLHGDDWFTITDDAIHTVYMRMTIRGGLNGTAVCGMTQKRWLHIDYH